MGFPSFFPHANPISLKPLSMTTLIPNFERKELPRDGVFQNETVSPTNMQFRSYWSYWQHAIYSFCLMHAVPRVSSFNDVWQFF